MSNLKDKLAALRNEAEAMRRELRELERLAAVEPESVAQLDVERWELCAGATRVTPTAAQMRLLQALLARRGQVVGLDQLLQAMLPGSNGARQARVVYSQVGRLRQRLGAESWRLRAVKGAGYMWRDALPRDNNATE